MKHMRLALIGLFLIGDFNSMAQMPDVQREGSTYLEKILKSDGTIDMSTGFSGSIDVKGWRMHTSPSGEPVFTRDAVPEDTLWDDQFSLPDVNGTVQALALSGSDLYVAGSFSGAGSVRATCIAKWNNGVWSTLGGQGTDEGGNIEAIAVSGSNVYVAGTFHFVGGISAESIARWNGSSWSALGSGSLVAIHALAVSGGDLYAGGFFTTIGGVPANHIARWNGTSWSALGTGTNSDVNAIAVRDTNVYVGGSFSTAGDVSANRIARWNGTRWDSLGSGIMSPSGRVWSLAVRGNDLYVGGLFTVAGGISATNIAKWDGAQWDSLGRGVNGIVYCVAVNGTDLLVGGNYTTAGGLPARCISKWNGSSWNALSSGISGVANQTYLRAIAANGEDVFVGGSFKAAGSVEANNIARWSNNIWSVVSGSGVHHGVYGTVEDIAVNRNGVYIGGSFTRAGGVAAIGVARWDGNSWSALGTGVDGSVYALVTRGDDVFAGGLFANAGGVPASNIARWNGTTWSALGSGVDNVVYALAVSDSFLFAGGSFTAAGSGGANRVAKWDGATWTPLGNGIAPSGVVRALATSGSDLYVGGQFQTAGGTAASNIAKWNGSTWSALGSGVEAASAVYTLAVDSNALYVAGTFLAAGGVSNANKIARWNGSAWSGLGNGISNIPSHYVSAIAVRGTEVYVGGSYNGSGGWNTARWNGSTWSGLGSSVQYGSGVTAVLINGGNVYFGSGCRLAGDKPSNMIARWFGTPVVSFTPSSGNVGSTVTITGGEFDPNPANNVVRFGSVTAVVSSASLSSLTVTVPQGATTAPISVTTRNLTGSSSASFVVNTTSVEQGSELKPKAFTLSQNYPNPFNPSTTIKYDLPIDTRVSLKIFNIIGQEVATLGNEEQKAGYKSVEWNASNFASGVYFCRLDAGPPESEERRRAGNFTSVKRLLLLK